MERRRSRYRSGEAAGITRMVTDAETQCYTCHAAKESSAYVFSRYRK